MTAGPRLDSFLSHSTEGREYDPILPLLPPEADSSGPEDYLQASYSGLDFLPIEILTQDPEWAMQSGEVMTHADLCVSHLTVMVSSPI